MKIKNGGKIEGLIGKIETIQISTTVTSRSFELWINESSLSYLSIEELLDLRDEITNALRSLIK